VNQHAIAGLAFVGTDRVAGLREEQKSALQVNAPHLIAKFPVEKLSYADVIFVLLFSGSHSFSFHKPKESLWREWKRVDAYLRIGVASSTGVCTRIASSCLSKHQLISTDSLDHMTDDEGEHIKFDHRPLRIRPPLFVNLLSFDLQAHLKTSCLPLHHRRIMQAVSQ
jgi:hypothetical protein